LAKKPSRKRPTVSSFPTYFIYTIQSLNFATLNHVLRQYGISGMYWRVLAVLQESDGHNINYLSSKLAIDRSNLSRIIDAMARSGLVERRTPPHDRRNVLVYLTEAGRQKIDEAYPDVLRIVEATTEDFTDKERQTLMALLQRMRDNALRLRNE
jgi:DNA-binding MarR family transcriptional regulator